MGVCEKTGRHLSSHLIFSLYFLARIVHVSWTIMAFRVLSKQTLSMRVSAEVGIIIRRCISGIPCSLTITYKSSIPPLPTAKALMWIAIMCERSSWSANSWSFLFLNSPHAWYSCKLSCSVLDTLDRVWGDAARSLSWSLGCFDFPGKKSKWRIKKYSTPFLLLTKMNGWLWQSFNQSLRVQNVVECANRPLVNINISFECSVVSVLMLFFLL